MTAGLEAVDYRRQPTPWIQVLGQAHNSLRFPNSSKPQLGKSAPNNEMRNLGGSQFEILTESDEEEDLTAVGRDQMRPAQHVSREGPCAQIRPKEMVFVVGPSGQASGVMGGKGGSEGARGGNGSRVKASTATNAQPSDVGRPNLYLWSTISPGLLWGGAEDVEMSSRAWPTWGGEGCCGRRMVR